MGLAFKLSATLLFGVALVGAFFAISNHQAMAAELKIEGTVSFTPSCTIWNAQTYRLNFHLPEDPDMPFAHFEGNIWGSGIENLSSGTSFSIDGPEGSIDSTGDAYVSLGNRKPLFVKAKFSRVVKPHVIEEPIGFGRWMVEIPMPPPSTKTYIYLIDPVMGEVQTLCDETRKLISKIP